MDRRTNEPRGSGADIETDGSGAGRTPTRRTSESSEASNRSGSTDGSRLRVASVRRRLSALVSRTRLGQFLSVGLLGALVDNGALVAIHGFGGLPLALAKLASAELAILFMFACNERWTFAGVGGSSPKALGRRVLTSNLVRLGGVAVATGVLLVLTEFGVWYVLANFFGIVVGALCNYVAESLLTWRIHRE